MAFPPGFLDEIKTRIALNGLVGRRVQLKQRGRGDWWGLSPFVAEKTPSFHVMEDKGYFHCFSSGEHGDHFTWLMKTEGLAFPEAVERLAGEAGLEMPERTPEQKAAAAKRDTLGDAMTAAAAFYQKTLQMPVGRAALDYVRQRGLDAAAIETFGLGYAPDAGDDLIRALSGEGVSERSMLEAGLLREGRQGQKPYPLFRDRLMFPIRDPRGRVIAFGGRFMGDAKAVGVGKYINSPDTALFDKSRTLYNLHAARQAAFEGQPLLVAEGYMDVIALAEYGFAASVAPLGTAITEDQIRMLWRLSEEPVLCLDGDEAGRRAALRAANRILPLLTPGKSVRFVFLPAGEDPDTLLRGRGTAAMTALIDAAEPLDLVLWRSESMGQKIDTPERRAALEDRLKKLAGGIEDETVRRQYLRAFADRAWEAFRAQRGQGPGRSGGRGAAGRTPPGRGRASMANRLKTLSSRQERFRQEILVSCFLAHPALLDEFAEDMLTVTLDQDLDKLLRELQNLFSSGANLDSEAVNHHFDSGGGGALVRTLRDPKILQAMRPGRGADDLEGARHTVEDILRVQSQNALAGELRSVTSRADGAGDEARILALRESYADGERPGAGLDDDVG